MAKRDFFPLTKECVAKFEAEFGEKIFPSKPKNRIFVDEGLTDAAVINKFAQESYVIYASPVIRLLEDFIEAKKNSTFSPERVLYSDMTVEKLVSRLMLKRPVVFFTGSDSYKLRNGHEGHGGFENFHERDEGPIQLAEYISYDEMQLSALMGVSVRTHFINK